MPESTLKWQRFNQKKPYFIATVFSLVAVVAAMGLLLGQLAEVKNKVYLDTHEKLVPQQERSERFKQDYAKLLKTKQDTDQIVVWMNDRYYWPDVLSEIRAALIRAEAGLKIKYRKDVDIWIDTLTTVPHSDMDTAASADPNAGGGGNRYAAAEAQQREAFLRRYGLPSGGPAAAPSQPTASASTPKKPQNPNELSSFDLVFRSISLSSVEAEANKAILFAVVNELKASPLFDQDTAPGGGGQINAEEPPGTFTFPITISLKRPLKL